MIIQENISLKPYNTFGIDVNANRFVSVNSLNELKDVIANEGNDIKNLIENKDFHAINIYVALCYYKMDYYDVSLEILAVYLNLHPDSIVGVNLKACNHY